MLLPLLPRIPMPPRPPPPRRICTTEESISDWTAMSPGPRRSDVACSGTEAPIRIPNTDAVNNNFRITTRSFALTPTPAIRSCNIKWARAAGGVDKFREGNSISGLRSRVSSHVYLRLMSGPQRLITKTEHQDATVSSLGPSWVSEYPSPGRSPPARGLPVAGARAPCSFRG
jgi:hypothetical protein